MRIHKWFADKGLLAVYTAPEEVWGDENHLNRKETRYIKKEGQRYYVDHRAKSYYIFLYLYFFKFIF